MRIVARRASEARIAFAPAATVFQAIRLEAHVGNTGEAALQDVGPGAMAGAAEIDGSDRAETAQIQDGAAALFDVSRLHGRYVLRSRAVAGLAGDSGCYVRGIKTISGGRSRRVTSKAAARFVRIQGAAKGGFKIVGRCAVVSRGEVQALQRSVKTQAALVEGAIVLIDVGLAFASEAESPGHGGGERSGAIGDGIGDGYRGTRKCVTEGCKFGRERISGLEDLGIGGWSRGLRHRRGDVGDGLFFVAFGALGGTNEIDTSSGAFCRPPARSLHAVICGHGDSRSDRPLSVRRNGKKENGGERRDYDGAPDPMLQISHALPRSLAEFLAGGRVWNGFNPRVLF